MSLPKIARSIVAPNCATSTVLQKTNSKLRLYRLLSTTELWFDVLNRRHSIKLHNQIVHIVTQRDSPLLSTTHHCLTLASLSPSQSLLGTYARRGGAERVDVGL
jgi:hypothetical protein